jgi:hypothetical protein
MLSNEEKAAQIAKSGKRIAKVNNEYYIFTLFTPPTVNSKKINLDGQNITKFLNTFTSDIIQSSNLDTFLESAIKERREFCESTTWELWLA